MFLLLVVLDHRKDVDSRQFCAAVQEREFDGEGCADHFSAQLAHEFHGRRGGASCGEQVIADKTLWPGLIASSWISSVSVPYSS